MTRKHSKRRYKLKMTPEIRYLLKDMHERAEMLHMNLFPGEKPTGKLATMLHLLKTHQESKKIARHTLTKLIYQFETFCGTQRL